MRIPAERQEIYARLERRVPEFVDELSEFARVPTISARREAEQDGAEATRRILERWGIPTRFLEVPGGPPLVVGEVVVDPQRPTLILVKLNKHPVYDTNPMYRAIPETAKATVAPAWPGPQTAASQLTWDLYVIPDMVAQYVTGKMTAPQAMEWAEKELKEIYAGRKKKA
jgi:hypothetical protein